MKALLQIVPTLLALETYTLATRSPTDRFQRTAPARIKVYMDGPGTVQVASYKSNGDMVHSEEQEWTEHKPFQEEYLHNKRLQVSIATKGNTLAMLDTSGRKVHTNITPNNSQSIAESYVPGHRGKHYRRLGNAGNSLDHRVKSKTGRPARVRSIARGNISMVCSVNNMGPGRNTEPTSSCESLSDSQGSGSPFASSASSRSSNDLFGESPRHSNIASKISRSREASLSEITSALKTASGIGRTTSSRRRRSRHK